MFSVLKKLNLFEIAISKNKNFRNKNTKTNNSSAAPAYKKLLTEQYLVHDANETELIRCVFIEHKANKMLIKKWLTKQE